MLIGCMLTVLSGAAAQAGDKPIIVNQVTPAAKPLYGVSRVQVSTFEGPHGSEVAEYIAAAFDNDRHGKGNADAPYLQEGLRTDPYVVVETGADAILSGRVSVDSRVESTKRRRAKKVAGKVVKDSRGKTVYVTVPCSKRIVTLVTSWQFRATDGSRQVAGSVSDDRSDEKCGENRSRVASSEQLVRMLVKPKLGVLVVDPLLPSWTVQKVGLRKGKGNREMIEAAQSGDWDRAMCVTRGAVATNPDPVDVYNLGALYEVRGWYDMASKQYERAATMDDARWIMDAQDRLRQRIRRAEAMAKGYGFEFKPPRVPRSDICSVM